MVVPEASSTPKPRANGSERVRLRLLPWLAIALAALVAIFASLFDQALGQDLDRELQRRSEWLRRMQSEIFAHEAKEIAAVAATLSHDARLAEALIAGDRELLLSYSRPIFDQLRHDHDVSHFYFLAADGTCVLRTHQPGRYGDKIERPSFGEAAATGRLATGVEVGPLGTLTQRVVLPWRFDNKLIGYLELGKEVGHVVEEVSEILGVPAHVFVRTRRLTREGQAEALVAHYDDGHISQGNVHLGKDPRGLPEEVVALMETGPTAAAPHGALFSSAEANYQIVFVALGGTTDTAEGAGHDRTTARSLSYVAMPIDIAPRVNEIRRALLLSIGIAATVGTMLLLLFWFYLGTVQRRLTRSRLEERRAASEREDLLQATQLANHDLRDFAYVVSHDLKAPLSGINQLATWLQEDCGDNVSETAARYLALLVSRSLRLRNMVSGVLRYSDLTRAHGKPTKVDTRAVTIETINAIERPDHIELQVEEEMPSLVIDRFQLQQLLQNLITNAIRNMDKVQGIVRVGCTDVGDHWRFFVQDNGPGIDPRHHEQIFKLFQIAGASANSESSGVGLAIVRHIAERNGGNVHVRSQVGEGATFFVNLPKNGAVASGFPGSSPTRSEAGSPATTPG